MCRNIRPLFHIDPPAEPEDVQAAARQFVRKVSGYQNPSRVNQADFEQAVSDISAAVQILLASLETTAPKRPAARPKTSSGDR
jgi:hypothetical protein